MSYTLTLRQPRSRWNYLVWPVLLAVATIEPVLRVISGDHFPTDVISGALAGSAFGLLVPAIHRRARSLPKVVADLQIAPLIDANRAMLTLGGQF